MLSPKQSSVSKRSKPSASQTKRSLNQACRTSELYRRGPGPAGYYECPFKSERKCGHGRTTQKCNYDKWIDSHLRPFQCREPDCKAARFSSVACLLRHERERHAMHGHGNRPFPCIFQACARAAPGHGFPRLYNLMDHMRRTHKWTPPEDWDPKDHFRSLPTDSGQALFLSDPSAASSSSSSAGPPKPSVKIDTAASMARLTDVATAAAAGISKDLTPAVGPAAAGVGAGAAAFSFPLPSTYATPASTGSFARLHGGAPAASSPPSVGTIYSSPPVVPVGMPIGMGMSVPMSMGMGMSMSMTVPMHMDLGLPFQQQSQSQLNQHQQTAAPLSLQPPVRYPLQQGYLSPNSSPPTKAQPTPALGAALPDFGDNQQAPGRSQAGQVQLQPPYYPTETDFYLFAGVGPSAADAVAQDGHHLYLPPFSAEPGAALGFSYLEGYLSPKMEVLEPAKGGGAGAGVCEDVAEGLLLGFNVDELEWPWR